LARSTSPAFANRATEADIGRQLVGSFFGQLTALSRPRSFGVNWSAYVARPTTAMVIGTKLMPSELFRQKPGHTIGCNKPTVGCFSGFSCACTTVMSSMVDGLKATTDDAETGFLDCARAASFELAQANAVRPP